MPEPSLSDHRHNAAHHTFQDVLGKLRLENSSEGTTLTGVDPLDGATVAHLLERNFSKLDPNGNGITREELAQAMLSPGMYTSDELVMLELVGKYFDTIANLCEDEHGKQTVITGMDKDVLSQFLVHSKLTLSDLHRWRSIDKHDEAE